MASQDMHSEQDVAQRKRQLLAEGAVYRASLVVSMQDVRQNLRADSLARRAAGFVASTAIGMVRIKGATGAGFGMQNFLPLAIEAFSLLTKRRSLKKILRTAAIVAAAAGAANMFLRKKKSPTQEAADKTAGEASGAGE